MSIMPGEIAYIEAPTDEFGQATSVLAGKTGFHEVQFPPWEKTSRGNIFFFIPVFLLGRMNIYCAEWNIVAKCSLLKNILWRHKKFLQFFSTLEDNRYLKLPHFEKLKTQQKPISTSILCSGEINY